jgi:hypothetical protein
MSFPIKHPAERLFAGVDWTDELEDGETISTQAVTAQVKRGKHRDGSPQSIISGLSTSIGAIQSQFIIGGVPGVDYETAWTITTSDGRTLEERVVLLVR